jgi:hypothetical protein
MEKSSQRGRAWEPHVLGGTGMARTGRWHSLLPSPAVPLGML